MVLASALTFSILPEELISEILSYVPREDRLWSCMVCKRFLKILFGLNNGVFELFTAQTNALIQFDQMLDHPEVSEIITHFVVAYPYESIPNCIQEIISSEVKGILVWKEKYLKTFKSIISLILLYFNLSFIF